KESRPTLFNCRAVPCRAGPAVTGWIIRGAATAAGDRQAAGAACGVPASWLLSEAVLNLGAVIGAGGQWSKLPTKKVSPKKAPAK
ncbi:hypothetical protein J7E49_26790, partial [Variovorax paradoxus]|nr:hypothetical protein [Variovorax paradoxus]